jgi:hypothetical protein
MRKIRPTSVGIAAAKDRGYADFREHLFYEVG